MPLRAKFCSDGAEKSESHVSQTPLCDGFISGSADLWLCWQIKNQEEMEVS